MSVLSKGAIGYLAIDYLGGYHLPQWTLVVCAGIFLLTGNASDLALIHAVNPASEIPDLASRLITIMSPTDDAAFGLPSSVVQPGTAPSGDVATSGDVAVPDISTTAHVSV